MERKMGMGFISTRMIPRFIIKVIGWMIRSMGKEDCCLKMGSIRDCGLTIGNMAKENYEYRGHNIF